MHHVTESEKPSVPPVLQDRTNKSCNSTADLRADVIFAEKRSTETLHVSIHYWKCNPAGPTLTVILMLQWQKKKK